MGCFCTVCVELSHRKLRAIPIVYQPQSRQLLTYVCQKWIFAALAESCIVELPIGNWPGLPRHYWSHTGDGHDQLLRALNKEIPSTLEILEPSTPIYVWTWNPHDLEKLFRSLFSTAFEFAILPSNHTTDHVSCCDREKKAELHQMYNTSSIRSHVEEIRLMHRFVQHSHHLSGVFKLCSFLKNFQSHIVPGRSDQGECDLVLTDVHERIWCIVEVKYIDTESHGKTARSRRTRNRKRVIEQAVNNRKRLFEQHMMSNPNARTSNISCVPSMLLILAATYTNDSGLQWATKADKIAAEVLAQQHFRT